MKSFFSSCLFFFLFLVTGCYHEKTTDLRQLKKQKAHTDKMVQLHSNDLIVLVKVPGKAMLVTIKNDNWPDEIECTYNILKNEAGKIIFIAQLPYSESGDWMIAYKHYFDAQGKTYAFSKNETIFIDQVKGDLLNEDITNYYDDNFKTMSQSVKLTDKYGKVVKKNNKNEYDFIDDKYSIYKDVGDCLTAYNIQLRQSKVPPSGG